MANKISMERVEQIIDACGHERHNLIACMQDIQAEYKYLSPEVLELIAKKLDIGVAQVYSVATFYENFSLDAKGEYIVKVCDGTACHVRKSQPILERLREYLDLQGRRKTSADGLFTLETVACLGACSLAPAMTVNDVVYAKMTPDSAVALLEELRKKSDPEITAPEAAVPETEEKEGEA